MLKRLISIMLILSLAFSLASCISFGDSSKPSHSDRDDEDEKPDDGGEKPDGGGDEKIDSCFVVLKNSDGTVLTESEIEIGSIVEEPVMPEVEGYTFIGWYESLNSDEPFDFTKPITDDIVLFAKWEGNKLPGTELTPTLLSRDYEISELIIDTEGGKVTVKASAKESCKVIIRFAEEEVYFSESFAKNKIYIEDLSLEGDLSVAEGESSAEVMLDIVGELPEYFVIIAVLVDSEGAEISEPMSSVKNTARYETFKNKTPNDFPADSKILGFGQNPTDNFGVLADDVKMLTAKSVTETALNNDGDVLYHIIGISETFFVGDKIYVRAEDGSEALFKAESIKESDTGITVVPASVDGENGYSLLDFYKFIKVDMTSFGTVTQGDEEYAQPINSTSEPTKEFDKTFKIINKDPFKIEKNNVTFKSNILGTITLRCSYLYDPVVFGEKYFECAVIMDLNLDFTLSLSYENSSSDEDSAVQERRGTPLFKVPTPIFAGFSPKIELGIIYEWEISASVTGGISIKKTLGFKYDPNNKITKISEKADISPIVDFEGEARLEIGPTVSLGVEFLKGIASANIEVSRTLVLTATTNDDERFTEAGARHDCYFCASGRVDTAWNVDGSLKVRLGNKLEWALLKFEILKVTDKNLYTKTVSKETEDSPVKIIDKPCENYTALFYIWNMNATDTSWTVTVYKGGTVLAIAAASTTDVDYNYEDHPVYLKKGETYKVVVVQGGENLDEVHIGEWLLVNYGGKWTCRFGVPQADGTWNGIQWILKPAKIPQGD